MSAGCFRDAKGKENPTWWDGVLDHLENWSVETPVTLPFGHCLTSFEVLRQVVDTNAPCVHDDATETTSGPDLGCSGFPLLHGPVHELDVVNQFQVLTEMVLAVESALFLGFLLAYGVVVSLDMSFIRVCLSTEDTGHLAILGVGCPRAFRSTYPSLERQVQGLFMSLPVVLGPESLCTESTLKGLERRRERVSFL